MHRIRLLYVTNNNLSYNVMAFSIGINKVRRQWLDRLDNGLLYFSSFVIKLLSLF